MKPIRGNLSRPGLPPLFLERRGAGGGGVYAEGTVVTRSIIID